MNVIYAIASDWMNARDEGQTLAALAERSSLRRQAAARSAWQAGSPQIAPGDGLALAEANRWLATWDRDWASLCWEHLGHAAASQPNPWALVVAESESQFASSVIETGLKYFNEYGGAVWADPQLALELHPCLQAEALAPEAVTSLATASVEMAAILFAQAVEACMHIAVRLAAEQTESWQRLLSTLLRNDYHIAVVLPTDGSPQSAETSKRLKACGAPSEKLQWLELGRWQAALPETKDDVQPCPSIQPAADTVRPVPASRLIVLGEFPSQPESHASQRASDAVAGSSPATLAQGSLRQPDSQRKAVGELSRARRSNVFSAPEKVAFSAAPPQPPEQRCDTITATPLARGPVAEGDPATLRRLALQQAIRQAIASDPLDD